MKKTLLLFVAISFSLLSCTKFREIDVRNIEFKGFKLLSTSSVLIDIGYDVKNPSKKDFFLERAEGLITKGGVQFATISLVDADSIKALSNESNNATFKLVLTDPLSLLSIGLDPSKWKAEEFRIDAKSFIKSSSGVRKCLKFKDLSLNSVIRKLN